MHCMLSILKASSSQTCHQEKQTKGKWLKLKQQTHTFWIIILPAGNVTSILLQFVIFAMRNPNTWAAERWHWQPFWNPSKAIEPKWGSDFSWTGERLCWQQKLEHLLGTPQATWSQSRIIHAAFRKQTDPSIIQPWPEFSKNTLTGLAVVQLTMYRILYKISCVQTKGLLVYHLAHVNVALSISAVQHERGPRNSTIRRQVAMYLKETSELSASMAQAAAAAAHAAAFRPPYLPGIVGLPPPPPPGMPPAAAPPVSESMPISPIETARVPAGIVCHPTPKVRNSSPYYIKTHLCRCHHDMYIYVCSIPMRLVQRSPTTQRPFAKQRPGCYSCLSNGLRTCLHFCRCRSGIRPCSWRKDGGSCLSWGLLNSKCPSTPLLCLLPLVSPFVKPCPRHTKSTNITQI